jgi:adsorption protein B
LENLMPYVLLSVQLLLAVVATVFVVSGADDFFIDVFHFVRRAYRRWFVMPKYEGLTERHLLLPAEQPIALMIPAWDESTVIGRMLENTLRTLTYANYHVFVGTYPNDRATQREVEAVREHFDNVHRIVCPEHGPTSKADCLNWIYQGIKVFEKEAGIRFEAFVIHDSEDILHPLSFKMFNYLIPRKDMVQLPVLPLEPRWWEMTGGHYMDEFAENHSKDLVVRERLAGVIPSAGVGCAFSRRGFDLVAAGNQNQLFNVDSVTEDYDFGFRLKEYGLQEVFVRHAIDRTTVRRNWRGERREVTVRELIATREFFPDRFRDAVRQKSRWVVGIALQGWVNLGWRGGGWTKYMLVRDRKAPFTNVANILGYVVVLAILALWAAPRIWPGSYRYPPLVERGGLLWYLVLVATFFLLVRLVQRVAFVGRLYGARQALLSVPRQLWGNVINFCASIRALWLFGRFVVLKEPIGWDKTAHQFPSEAQLQSFRRRLGDLLLEKRYVTLSQLDEALQRQEEEGRPLGRVLLEMGLVEEDSIVQVLGQQLQLDTRQIDPYKIRSQVLALLPREVAIRHGLFPLEVRQGGRLVVAADRPLRLEEVVEVEQKIDRPIEVVLSATSDIAFAIKRGYGRPELAEHTDIHGSPLGQLLLQQGLVTEDQLREALRKQRRSYRRLGEVLVEEKILRPEVLEQAVERHQAEGMGRGRLGDFLVQQGYLGLEVLERALELQQKRFQRLGDVVVEMGLITRRQLADVLRERPA